MSGAPDALVDFHTGKLKEDKAGKNSNPDVNVTLRAFDPPLRYPLNESDLKDKCSSGVPQLVLTQSTRRSRRFRVIGEEDDRAEALEDLRRKKKAEHKREMKKKEEKGPKVDKKKAEAELNATLANLTLPPKSTEPWDVDPGGLPAPGGGPELVVVHRSNLAYVGVEFRAV